MKTSWTYVDVSSALSLCAMIVTGTFLASEPLGAQEPLPYEASFEPGDGFRSGDVNGQRGFTVVRGQAAIARDAGVNGSAGLKLEPSQPFGIVQLSIDAGLDAIDSPDRVVHTEFMIRPGAGKPGEADQFADVEGSLSGFFKIDEEGELYLFDGEGDELGDGKWLQTGTRFTLEENGLSKTWITLSVRQDFATGLWDVAINGDIFRANLAMAQAAESLETIEFVGQSRLPLFVDNIRVSRNATAFEDQDRDGLPDSWERAHGLATGEDRRNDDPDKDGLSNVEELVLGTLATVGDTDGDGINDGDEYASGSDPLIDSGREVAAASEQTAPSGLTLVGGSCDETTMNLSLGAYVSATVTHVVEVQAAQWYPTLVTLTANGSASGPYITVHAHATYGFGETVRVGVTAGMSDGSTLYGLFEVSCECSCGCVSVDAAVASLDLKFGLGTVDFGKFGQDLFVKEPSWSDRLYHRSSVRYPGANRLGRTNHIMTEIGGEMVPVLDWVRTDTQFTRLVDRPHGYAIEAFHLNQVDEQNQVTGQPFRRIRVENPDPDGLQDYHSLRITEDGGRNSVREYRHKVVNGVEEWELFEGDSQATERPLRYHKLIKLEEERLATRKGPKVVTEWRQQGHWDPELQQLVIDHEKALTYQHFPYGRKLVKEVLDPNGQALTTTWGYVTDFQPFKIKENPAGFAQLEPLWVALPDGDWEWYGYDDLGRRNRIVRPIGNTPRPVSLPETLEGYRVTTVDFDATGTVKTTREWRDGQLEKATQETRHRVGNLWRVETLVAYGWGEFEQRTYRTSDHRGLLRQENPDGTLVTVDRRDDGDLRTEVRFQGAADRSFGTEILTVTHRSGLVMEKRVVDVRSGIAAAHEKVLKYDDRFRAVLTANELTGKMRSAGFDCCDLEWEAGEDGSAIVHQRDALGRITVTQTGFKLPLAPGNTLDVMTSTVLFDYDGLDRNLRAKDLGSAETAEAPLTSTQSYNLSGQSVASISPNGIERRHKTIMLEDGGRLELTSLPKTGIDHRYRISSRIYSADAELMAERSYASTDPFATEPDPGTQTRHLLYERGRDLSGERYSQVTDIANIFDRRVKRSYVDGRGRTTRVIHAYGTPLAAEERFDYNERDQLLRHVDPDGVTTRYTYTEEGKRLITAIDLKVNPGEAVNHIDLDVDRITRTRSKLVTRKDGVDVRQQLTEVFTENGPVITQISEQSLDGIENVTFQNGLKTTRQRVEGEVPGQWSIVTTKPDGSQAVEQYEDGRPTRNTRHAADGTVISWIAQTYDEHGRVAQVTDSRTGTTTYHYDLYGRRVKVSAPNPATGSSTEGILDTLYQYDALGQLIATTKPSGGVVYQDYSANGTLYGTRGHHTNDVNYRYNGRGERTHLITYYGTENKPAATHWSFNARGQLAFKQDAHGKRVHYTYTPGGKLRSRTWARGVVTNYHYDPDNGTDLRAIKYSDGTPDIHFAYTRLGQKHTVNDAGGTTTYVYRPNMPTKLFSEASGTELYAEPKTVTYTEDDYGRSSGFQIGTTADPDQDYAVGYGYDAVGRLAHVQAHRYWFYYGYEPNSTSDRVKSLTAPFLKQTTIAYEPGRDTIVSVSNRVGFQLNQEISRFTYSNNVNGQRVARDTFRGGDTQAENYVDQFRYDPDTGGLTASKREGGEAPREHAHAYRYDKIGNRLRAETKDSEVRYVPNALNQYDSVDGDEPEHDADGNMTRQGDRTYTWDAENRLIAIHERGSWVASYTYDHLSRRIARKTRYAGNERYLYQGWNLIAVYDPEEEAPVETFTWGKDLSGTFQGAGGVGGLLFAKRRDIESEHGAWIYHYDANGNVVEVSDARGLVLDRYEYDVFGNLIGSPRLSENRWRFSTKIMDEESGFSYYGYRYYDPEYGCWVSRDPISENGGVNLYTFALNNPISLFDVFGLDVGIEGWVYIIVNHITEEYYVGETMQNPPHLRWNSSHAASSLFNKNGTSAYVREIKAKDNWDQVPGGDVDRIRKCILLAAESDTFYNNASIKDWDDKGYTFLNNESRILHPDKADARKEIFEFKRNGSSEYHYWHNGERKLSGSRSDRKKYFDGFKNKGAATLVGALFILVEANESSAQFLNHVEDYRDEVAYESSLNELILLENLMAQVLTGQSSGPTYLAVAGAIHNARSASE